MENIFLYCHLFLDSSKGVIKTVKIPLDSINLHIIELKEKINNEFLSIDLGINNLMTCIDTKNIRSFILDGKHFKWKNQFFNERLADKKIELKNINHKIQIRFKYY